MEDGEVLEEELASSGLYDEYNPDLEWPAETREEEQPDYPKIRHKRPCFRLVVLSSPSVKAPQRLVIADDYTELQFGRDAASAGSAHIPRVRLGKEMHVSKLHASCFWDGHRREWSVVDMGSVHGTFVKTRGSEYADSGGFAHPSSSRLTPQGIRLSTPRVASVPHRLRHLDELTVGASTFSVHVHPDQMPCEDCCSTVEEKDVMNLFAPSNKSSHQASINFPATNGHDLPHYTLRDPKKALNSLKQNLLMRHTNTSSVPLKRESNYVDRSAKRRALYPKELDAPGATSRRASPTNATSMPNPVPTESWEPPPEVKSKPSTPINETNLGYKLLMKQGWEPGTGLAEADSVTGMGRVDPIDPLTVGDSRKGLGMPRVSSINAGQNWKIEGKYRRWDDL